MSTAAKLRRQLTAQHQSASEDRPLADRLVAVAPTTRQRWIELEQVAYDDLDVVARVLEGGPQAGWTGCVVGFDRNSGSFARSRAPVADELVAGPDAWREIAAIPLAVLA